MPSLLRELKSSSASSSPSNSPQNVKTDQYCLSSPRRKLTRQRKLKNVSDDQLGLRRPVQSTPEYNRTRSENHWSRSAVPQPLPLPDVNLHSKHRNKTADILSPSGEVSTKVDGDLSYFVNSRNVDELTRVKAVDHTTTTYARRGFFQGLNAEGVEPVFELNVPRRSAPGSAFSSPINSPRSLSTTIHCLAPNHHPRHNIIACADHSPLHSPNRHYGNQHLHHKPIQKNCMQRHECSSGDLHQLPLPPAVSRPIQSPTVHHCLDSLELSPMKGQWQRGKLIGRGTYGSVYVATHRETGALCAMKEVDVIPDDPTCVERIKQLEQEINLLQQLRHPNIVQYYGSEIIEDRFCIYLEYVHPGSIKNYVREHCGAMTECIVRSFTRHILSGLAYLHSKKTIHRDIKGANLLVNASGVVKLADFGLAKHLTGSVMNLSLKGSPHWMAPEVLQAVLRKDTNPDQAWALDIWSLGCTVIEMFTGKPPWSEYTGVKAMFSVLNKIPPIPETLTGDGKHFLKLCLRREPMNRPSAADLLDHAFLQNRQDKNTGCAEEFSEKLVLIRSRSPKDLSRQRNDLMLLSSNHQGVPTELRPFGQISPRSRQENSESRATSSHSPRSTLEILPSIYSPELKGNSSPRNSWERARDTSFASLRNHGKQI